MLLPATLSASAPQELMYLSTLINAQVSLSS
jgi:hypothetical protein